jgi:glucose-6-phosphate isomerase
MVEYIGSFESDILDSDISEAYEAIIEECKSEEVGYYNLPQDVDTITSVEKFCADYDFSSVKNIVVVGIGGSSLGTKAIDYLLQDSPQREDKNLLFLENVDPNEIERSLKGVEFEESFFIVISKSGGTIETTSHLKYLSDRYRVPFESDRFRERFVVITDPNSPLDAFAKETGVKVFNMPKNVGGRFSVFSAVGILPLQILGYDVRGMLKSAKALKESFFAKKEDDLIKKAYYYAKNSKEFPINVIFSYSSNFRYFNDWFVQLWGESLGKINRDGERVGLTPVGVIGSIDQHSFLQLIIEGPRDKTVTMIKVRDFQNDLTIPDISIPYLQKTDFINSQKFSTLLNAQCDATMESIKDQGITVDMIELEKITEAEVGELILYFELLTSVTGYFLNINTYDQPGVELGKKILKTKFEKI